MLTASGGLRKKPGTLTRSWVVTGYSSPRLGGSQPVSSTLDICAFCHKTVSPRELGVEAMERQYTPSASRAVSAANGWPGRASTRRMGGPSVKPATRTPGEVCQVCKVVRERIIRALGQAFHPSCV